MYDERVRCLPPRVWRHRRHAARCCTAALSPISITPTLRQSPGQVPDKVSDTNHESRRRDLCRGLSWFMSATSPRLCRELVTDFVADLTPTFRVYCNGLNSIRVCRKFVTDFVANILACRDGLCPTFVICVGDFHRNFMVSWFVTVCVLDFHDLCSRLSPREVSVKIGVMKFGLYRRGGSRQATDAASVLLQRLTTTAPLFRASRCVRCHHCARCLRRTCMMQRWTATTGRSVE